MPTYLQHGRHRSSRPAPPPPLNLNEENTEGNILQMMHNSSPSVKKKGQQQTLYETYSPSQPGTRDVRFNRLNHLFPSTTLPLFSSSTSPPPLCLPLSATQHLNKDIDLLPVSPHGGACHVSAVWLQWRFPLSLSLSLPPPPSPHPSPPSHSLA